MFLTNFLYNEGYVICTEFRNGAICRNSVALVVKMNSRKIEEIENSGQRNMFA